MQLDKLLGVTGGRLVGVPFEFVSISIDSRNIKPGDLYIAIIGENLDGHDFCEEAIRKGAVACLVDRELTPLGASQVVVKDTTKALGDIAENHRDKFDMPFVAITGSCGKTTVKQMVASILSQAGSVFASRGNFNNHIGMPLSLLELADSYEYGVFELGASHVGEIADLGKRLKHEVSVITTVGSAHIEGFGSVENIADAKSEIFQTLKPHGTAIAEVDSPYLNGWRKLRTDLDWLTFGLVENADVSARHLQLNASGCYRFELVTCLGTTEIELPLLGKHNVKNATAKRKSV